MRARIRRFYPEDEADDVLQEVFVRVMDKLHTWRGECAISTWLYQVTTRHCLNRLRNSARQRELLDQERGSLWGAEVTPADQEIVVMLRELWGTLDEEVALVAVYYHLDGMTREDIARVLNCSVRTVGYRLEQLRKAAPAEPKAGA